MKYTKKLIAVLLAVIIAFSAVVSVTAESVDTVDSGLDIRNLTEYKEYLMDEGYPVFTTAKFYGIFNTFSNLMRMLSFNLLFSGDKFNVEVDEFLTGVSEEIALNSGLDFLAIINNLPESNQLADIVTTTFQIDTAEMRAQMQEKSNQYFDEGNSAMGAVCGLIGIYMSVITKCEIYAVPNEDNPDIYETYIRLTYKDGGTEEFYPGLIIDTVTGECYNHNDMGIVGVGFNMNLSEMLVYATVNCWMRDFGFCYLYDVIANMMPVFFRYDTRRFKFEYNGLEYMIQIWKGNYTVANGGEVGVYCRDKSAFGSYYDCANDEQMLEMSMQILHGEKILVNKPLQLHWWVNGFNLSTRMYLPESLTMKFTIVMTDEEMLKAFCESIDKHYMHDVTYSVDGLTVNCVW